MSAEHIITIEVDETKVNASVARINQQIAQIGARAGGAPGVTALNNQLQQVIAQNPAVARVITSLGGTGTAAQRSAGQTGGLANALGRVGAANPQLAGVANGLRGIGQAASTASAASGGMFGSIGASAQAALSQVAGLGGSMAGIATAGGALVGAAAIGGLVALGTAAVNASAKMESYRASLTTILGDSDKAAQAFDRLTQFAAKTPFSLDQSVEGFIKLKALGLTPSEAALTSYGNTASSMGKDLNQMIEAVADAATGEFERLKEFGIKSKVEGNKVAFTFQGVTTKIGNNSKDIQKYLQSIGNVQFAGAMERQMATFAGATSNLSDTVQQTLAKIGDGLNKPIATVINMVTNGISAITPLLGAIGSLFGGMISGAAAVASGIGSAFGAIISSGTGSVSILETLTFTVNLIAQGFQVLGQIVGSVFQFIGGLVGSLNSLWRSTIGGMLADTTAGFNAGGRSWGNSIVGILRTVKVVAGLMPQLFSIAITDIAAMFRTLGSAIGSFLSGDFNAFEGITGRIKSNFASTAKAATAIGRIGNATYKDEKGADAAINRMMGRGRTGGASLDDLAGAAPTGKPAGAAGDDKAAKEAAKKAADRLKAEQAYWQALDQTAKTASMLPAEAERYNKQLELRRILGDGELKDSIQLTAAQTARIDGLLKEKALGEAMKATRELIVGAEMESRKLQEEIALQTGVSAEKAAENLAVHAKLWPIREAAMKQGLNLNDEQLKKELSILEALERQNIAIKRANDLRAQKVSSGVDYVNDALKSDGTQADRKKLADEQYAKVMDDVRVAFGEGKVTVEGYNAAMKRAGREWEEAVGRSAATWASKAGTLLSSIGSQIGGKVGEVFGQGANAFDAFASFKDVGKDISGKFEDVFGQGKLAQGVGKAVGGAVAGLGIGESIAGLGKMLGANKGFQTGSKVGGAVGGAVGGPLGSVIGSLAGGLFGSLFYKPRHGMATLTGMDDATLSGNKGSLKKAAGGAAASVQEGLANLAKQIGGTVGKFDLIIGQYDGKWRVRDSAEGWNGKGGLNFKGASGNGLTDFGKEGEADAIAFAIKTAISQGAITGLSQTVQRALQVLGADAAIEFAKSWKEMMDDYDSIVDPVGSAVRNLISPIDAMRESLIKIGATAEDQTKLADYRTKKLDQLMKEQMSTYDDLIETLNGKGAGITAADRYRNDLAKFNVLDAKIAKGENVDQNELSKVVSTLFGTAQDYYGGTASKEYQDLRQRLIDVVNGGKQLAVNEFNVAAGITSPSNSAAQDSTTNAINQGNAQITTKLDTQIQQAAIQNGYSEKILEALEKIGASQGGGGGGLNGRTAQV